jgi:hypothetical protein
MPWASLKSNANRSQLTLRSIHRRPNQSRDTTSVIVENNFFYFFHFFFTFFHFFEKK